MSDQIIVPPNDLIEQPLADRVPKYESKPLARIIPNLDHARRFLEYLDPHAKEWCFQTFADGRRRARNPWLTRIITGPIDVMWSDLKRLNCQGAGIFFTTNYVENGRKLENLKRIRFVWRELDRLDGHFARIPPLPPCAEVLTSPGHVHQYWRVQGNGDLKDEVELFSRIMHLLVQHYGSDPQAKDAVRVLRLPGTWNCKDHSACHPVGWFSGRDDTVYPLDEFLDALEVDIRAKGYGGDPEVYSGHIYNVSRSEISEEPESEPEPEPTTPADVIMMEMRQCGVVPDPSTWTRAHRQRDDSLPIVEIARIWSALYAIPVGLTDKNDERWVSRDDWIRAGMVLHALSRGSLEGSGLWDEWSQRDEDRYVPGECARLWAGFRKSWLDGERSQGLHVGTLYQMAYARGWDGKIVQPSVLPAHLIERLKEVVILQRTRMLRAMTDRTALWLSGGKLRVVNIEFDKDLDTPRLGVHALSDFKAFHTAGATLPRWVERLGDDGQQVSAVEHDSLYDAWAASSDRKRFKGQIFDPRGDMFFDPVRMKLSYGFHTNDSTPSLNLYLGQLYTPCPIAERDPRVVPILRHIYEVWCDEDLEIYEYVLAWLARLVQDPGYKHRTVLVLQSEEGAGKNIISDILDRNFGANGCTITDPEQLLGRFNGVIATSVFLVLNEAVHGAIFRHRGKLKSLITDNVIAMERKFMEIEQVVNRSSIILLSNEHWCAPVGVGDRRYVYLPVQEPRDQSYYDQLRSVIESGGDRAFVQYLRQWRKANIDKLPIPARALKEKQFDMVHGMSGVMRWYAEILHEGQVILKDKEWGRSEVLMDRETWEAWGGLVPKNLFFDVFDQHQRDYPDHFKRILTRQMFYMELWRIDRMWKEINPTDCVKMTVNGEQVRAIRLMKLDEHRKNFARLIKNPEYFGDS